MLLLLPACYYSPPETISTTESEILFTGSPVFSGTFALIYENDVYLFSKVHKEPERLTFTPEQKKSFVALSYDKEKIAYLDSTGVPQIIDKRGVFINSVTTSAEVKDMGWSPDSKTLYMLVNNQLVFYGPSMNIGPLNPHVNTPEIYSVSISENLDLAYSFKSSRRIGNNSFSKVDYKNPTKADEIKLWTSERKYIRISRDGSTYLTASDAQQRTPITSSRNDVWIHPEGSSEQRIGPFNSSFSPIWVGEDSVAFGIGKYGRYFNQSEGYNYSNFFIGDVTDPNESKYLTFFEGTSENMYLDWKP